MERTKKGLITHELTSIIMYIHNIEKKIKDTQSEKAIKVELDRIDKTIMNIDKLNK